MLFTQSPVVCVHFGRQTSPALWTNSYENNTDHSVIFCADTGATTGSVLKAYWASLLEAAPQCSRSLWPRWPRHRPAVTCVQAGGSAA